MEREKLLTKIELAERLKLSTRSIDRKIELGELPRGFKLGASVRWRESIVDQWIADGCPKVAQ